MSETIPRIGDPMPRASRLAALAALAAACSGSTAPSSTAPPPSTAISIVADPIQGVRGALAASSLRVLVRDQSGRNLGGCRLTATTGGSKARVFLRDSVTTNTGFAYADWLAGEIPEDRIVLHARCGQLVDSIAVPARSLDPSAPLTSATISLNVPVPFTPTRYRVSLLPREVAAGSGLYLSVSSGVTVGLRDCSASCEGGTTERQVVISSFGIIEAPKFENLAQGLTCRLIPAGDESLPANSCIGTFAWRENRRYDLEIDLQDAGDSRLATLFLRDVDGTGELARLATVALRDRQPIRELDFGMSSADSDLTPCDSRPRQRVQAAFSILWGGRWEPLTSGAWYSGIRGETCGIAGFDNTTPGGTTLTTGDLATAVAPQLEQIALLPGVPTAQP